MKNFIQYARASQGVCPIVYDNILTKLRTENPSAPVMDTVIKAAKESAGKALCKACPTIIDLNTHRFGCCSLACYRDAFLS